MDDESKNLNEGYKIDLVLYSEGFSWEEEEGEPYLKGKGYILLVSLYSNEKSLVKGKYTFSTETPPPIESFDYSEFFEWDSEAEDEIINSSAIVGGTINVSKNGNDYVISIDCVTEDNETVKGYYKGTFRTLEIEESE